MVRIATRHEGVEESMRKRFPMGMRATLSRPAHAGFMDENCVRN